MNKATLSILTAVIALSSVKAFAKNSQTSVKKSQTRVKNQLAEEEYLKQLRMRQHLKNTELMVENHRQVTKMKIKAAQDMAETARKIGAPNHEYEYVYRYDYDY